MAASYLVRGGMFAGLEYITPACEAGVFVGWALVRFYMVGIL